MHIQVSANYNISLISDIIFLKFYGMKIITIGRGEDCNIIFSDPVISRKHALLKIYPTGKMEIVDIGQNGTFVNGVRLAPNTPYPVTRKDVISFAQVRQLDWKSVPDNMLYIKYVLAGIVLIVILVLALFIKEEFASKDVPEMDNVHKTEKSLNKEKADDIEKNGETSDKNNVGDDGKGQPEGESKPAGNNADGSDEKNVENTPESKQESNVKYNNINKFKNKLPPNKANKKQEKKTENKEENKEENSNNSFIL